MFFFYFKVCAYPKYKLPAARGRNNRVLHAKHEAVQPQKKSRGPPAARSACCDSAPVIGKARGAAPAYLTDPAQTGFTVTLSRGLSPHSAAGEPPPARAVPIFDSIVLYHTPRRIARASVRSVRVAQRAPDGIGHDAVALGVRVHPVRLIERAAAAALKRLGEVHMPQRHRAHQTAQPRDIRCALRSAPAPSRRPRATAQGSRAPGTGCPPPA